MKLENLDLPDDWQVKQIREVYTFTKKPRGLVIANDSLVAFLPMQAIPIGRVRVSNFEERVGASLTSGTYIENGDLLVAKITPSFENGKQAVVDWKKPFGFATTEVIPIQEIKDVSDKFFLFHLLLHPAIRSDLAGKMDGTTGRKRLSKEVFGSRFIPFPPLDEQRKIAAVLGLVQRAIEQQERLLQLTVELKKTLLHQLFAQGLRGEPQKQTEIGPVPESWDIHCFGDVATFKNGINFTSAQKGNKGILTIDVLNMYANGSSVVLDKVYRVNKSVNEDCHLKDGDLLFVRSSVKLEGVGWTSMFRPINEPVTFCGFIIRARLHDQNATKPKFLTHYFRTDQARRALVSGGAKVAITNINQGLLQAIVVPVPSVEEQDGIANAIDQIDRKVALCKSKKAKLEDLFRTLLHQLMTAQIRVYDIDLPELTSVEERHVS